MARKPRVLPETSNLENSEVATVSPAEPLADVAYRKLKSAIMNGSLYPGLQAAEQKIAEQLGMSRTPIHQAMVRLQHEGLVELSPRKGVTVSQINYDDFEHIYQTLKALEGLAVTLLANKAKSLGLKAEQRLEQACQAGEIALEKGDLNAWAEADDAFHNALLEESGNPILAQMGQLVMEKSRRARALTLKLRPLPTASNEDHRAIVEAIKRSDTNGARVLLERHRDRGMNVLLPILKAIISPDPFLRF